MYVYISARVDMVLKKIICIKIYDKKNTSRLFKKIKRRKRFQRKHRPYTLTIQMGRYYPA